MKFIGVGGFFHDFNFSFYQLGHPESLLSSEEERFSRKKMHSCLNQNRTSLKALYWIMKESNSSFEDISFIIFSDNLEQPVYKFLTEKFPNAKEIRIGHHLSHVGNVLSMYKIEDADFFCFDGYGDGLSGISGEIKKKSIVQHKKFTQSNSLGLLYTSATNHVGLGGFGSEGKLQGLAPYGYYEEEYSLRELLDVTVDGIFLDDKLKKHTGWQQQEQYAQLALSHNEFFSQLIPKRFPDEKITKTHKNFAYTVQLDIQKAIIEFIQLNISSVCNQPIIFSGGLAQNSTIVANLSNRFSNRRVITTTSCSDRGNSLGALAVYLQEGFGERISSSPFLGYDANKLDLSDLKGLKKVGVRDLITYSAQKIKEGELVATFIGKTEYGARALGNRSILANPQIKDMRKYLNSKVKHREMFRPYAPIIPNQLADSLFKLQSDCDFMTKCIEGKNSTKELLPSAVHIDNTSRIQIARENTVNETVFSLLNKINEKFDIPGLINTSLNDSGEPIANTIYDVLRSMDRCGIRYLLTEKGLYERV